MGVTGTALFCALFLACMMSFPTAVQAGDAAKAKRDLNFAKNNVESQRWDDADAAMKKVAADMDGLSDAEKAPLLAEIGVIKATASKLIEEEVIRRLDRAGKAEPAMVGFELDQASRRLDSDEAKNYMDPAVMARLRARIVSMKPGNDPAKTPPVTTTPEKPATPPTADHYDIISRARRNLSVAKIKLERGPEGVEDELKKVDVDLQTLTDAEKAPIAAEVATIRQQIGGSSKPVVTTTTPPVTTTVPKTNTPVGNDADRADAIARAKRNLNFAKSSVERDPANAESQLKKVDKDLEILTEAERAPLAAEVAAIREQVAAGERAEMAKPIEQFVNQKLDYCNQQVGSMNLDVFNMAMADAVEKIDSPEAKKYLDSAKYKQLKERIEETRLNALQGQKTTILQRVLTGLKKQDDELATHPYKGVRYTTPVDVEFNRHLRDLREYLHYLPGDDADGKATEAKIVAFERKIDAAKAVAAKAMADEDAAKLAAADAAEKKRMLEEAEQRKAESIARKVSDWKQDKEYIHGWEEEQPAPSPDARRLQENPLPKTEQALQSFRRWISDSAEMRAKYPNDASLKAAMADAEKTLDAAGAKSSAAYNTILDIGEKMAAPPSHYADQSGPERIASITERVLEGTRYRDATVARAKALQHKWETAVAAAEKAKKELYAQLSAEASAAWPRIDASVHAAEGFNPSDAGAWKGKTIKLKQIWNRSGWDFSPSYDFSLRVDGIPVAGNFDPKVLKAYQDGVERAKQSIDDHKNWDVIAVVEGTGTIKYRFKREVIVKETNEKFNLESWEPTPCVVIRIIGLHAGPIAVGPN